MSIDNQIIKINRGRFQKYSYSIEDVTVMLDVTRQTVYKLLKEDLFKVVKINNEYRIDKASFDKWLDNEWGGFIMATIVKRNNKHYQTFTTK